MAVNKKQPRAYELAKELGVPVKDLVTKLSENGVAVKSNFTLLDNEQVLLARKLCRPLSGGLKAAKEIEDKEKKAQEDAARAADEAAQAQARAEAEAAARAKAAAAPRPAPATPKPAAPKPASGTRVAAAKPAAAKPAAAAKPSAKTTAFKGPQPATQSMPGSLSRAPEPVAAAVEAAPPVVESDPAEAAAKPATIPAPPVESAALSSASAAPAAVVVSALVQPAPAAPARISPPQPRPAPPRQEARPRPAPAAKPAPKPVVPPTPPRPVFYGPSPAPADYESRPRPVPKPIVVTTASALSGPGPQIRPQAHGTPGARPAVGRPGAPAAPAPGQRPSAPAAPGQKTIFRFDEKEEERKRKDREKELAKEAEKQRRDAVREAHKKKQEKFQARRQQRDEADPHTEVRQEMARPEPVEQQLRLPDTIIVSELATLFKKTPIEVVTKLIGMGTMASVNQRIDFDVASIVATEFGFRAVLAEEDAEFKVQEAVERPVDPAQLRPRPPVVTVMGHVDHGKTSLLDAIRESKVAEGEHGGITQHIGAYQVKLPTGQLITFLDTPGHEAFTAMRAHGAKVTDCAILVVAADDGVMPQTVEAIHHAQAAGVPILVAINKMDKPGANAERVKQELTKHNLLPEEWGGKTICVPVSATKRENLTQLLEMIVLQSEMLELKANPSSPARGVVIESKLDKGRGPLATILVQEGTLRIGDPFVAGTTWGKVRALLDDMGNKVKEVGPGAPVNVMGFESVAEVATTFSVVEDEAAARDLVARRLSRKKAAKTASAPHLSLEDLFAKVKEGVLKELKVIIKADTHGSATALADSLSKVSNEEVQVVVLHAGVGAISETDVMFAAASDAILIGFHVRPNPAVTRLAQQEKVDVRLYSIIYEAVGEVEAAIKGMLAPKFQEVVFGHAEVRQAFSVPKVGRIAGSYVLDGKIVRNGDARVIRDGVEVYTGKIASLRRFKEDTKEVLTGFECGIGLDRFTDVKEKDIIEVFRRQEMPRE